MARDEPYDLVICGGELVTDERREMTDIAVRGGRIAALGDLRRARTQATLDAKGLSLLPGAIDSQVHFREPGAPQKEDLESGSLAAVMGGITAVFEMPNTKPPTTNADALADKLRRAAGRMHCDYAFYVGADATNAKVLGTLEWAAGVCGVKVFMGSSTGSLLVATDAQLEEVLRATKRRAAFHAEDEARLVARRDHRRAGDVLSHVIWRDAESAAKATRRLVRMARRCRHPAHVLHVSTAEEMDLLADGKPLISVETTPQHLTLAAPDAYERWGSLAQMNPPIRDRSHQEALWRGVQKGVVDVIGSDHAPHSRDEKSAAYPDSPSGMPGVQTLLPVMLTHVAAGRLSLERLVALTSANVVRLFGLRGKGLLQPGWQADVTFVDTRARYELTESWLKSRCGWSPFVGMQLTGRVCGTMIRGERIMWEDELLAPHRGEALEFASGERGEAAP